MISREDCLTSHATASALAASLQLPTPAQSALKHTSDHFGQGSGSSLDFQDHREYMLGDDTRHIDWNAYARTGFYTMKQFHEEVRPIVDLIFDVSPSMFFDVEKKCRTLELFYWIVESSKQSAASLHIHVVGGHHHQLLEADAVQNHHWIQEVNEWQTTPIDGTPQLAAIPLRAKSNRILLSDLLFSEDPKNCLRNLTHYHGSLLLFCPFLASEAEPRWAGNVDFIDVESGLRRASHVDQKMLDGYLASYARHYALWSDECARHGGKIVRVAAEGDFAEVMFRECMAAGMLAQR